MINKQGVSKSGDVYQIGVVLHEMLVGIAPYYDDDMDILYQNIQKGKLKLPKYLSNEAKRCLQRLLNKDPSKRPSLRQLKKDPFFADIDWNMLEKKELAPPQILTREASDPKEEDEEDMLFEKDDAPRDQGREEQVGGQMNKPIFIDEDYTQKNIKYLRLKSYSFARN